jgi:DNA modification methylase
MLIRADARSLPLAAGCVQCVVTSPPYFGLRDYGTPGQLGLEATPDAYVSSLVQVFRELRRVLKDSGTVWCNLGDSYASDSKGSGGPSAKQLSNAGLRYSVVKFEHGMKAKDLMGIPWRVAFALQADGWYLRSDIIWSKPNPMPESVTDRPTKAHEYLFLLSKSERYHYDARAIAEPVSWAMLAEMEQGYNGLGLKDYDSAGVQNPSRVKARIILGARKRERPNGVSQADAKLHPLGYNSSCGTPDITRNRRSVWTIPTMPYAGAHFATMPEALVEPCILAGCPLGGLVLDPFIGSGTVGAVAERLGRRWVGTDLSYQPLAAARTRQRGLRFDQESA